MACVANVFTVKGGGFIFTIVGGHSDIFRSRFVFVAIKCC